LLSTCQLVIFRAEINWSVRHNVERDADTGVLPAVSTFQLVLRDALVRPRTSQVVDLDADTAIRAARTFHVVERDALARDRVSQFRDFVAAAVAFVFQLVARVCDTGVPAANCPGFWYSHATFAAEIGVSNSVKLSITSAASWLLPSDGSPPTFSSVGDSRVPCVYDALPYQVPFKKNWIELPLQLTAT